MSAPNTFELKSLNDESPQSAKQTALTRAALSETESSGTLTAEGPNSRPVIPFSERIRELNGRLVLGQKLAATLTEKYAAERLQDAIDSRDFRRYFVLDQTSGIRRSMSIHDVEQRARLFAGRITNEQLSNSDDSRVQDWSEFRDREYSRQIEKHASTLQEIRDAHATELQKLTSALRSAHHANIRLTPAAQAIEASYNGTGAELPVPIIPHEKLNDLQLNAIRNCDADGFEQLERVRRELPHELGGPERDTFSFARLKGRAILANSNVAVAQKRLDDFEKSRHFAKFDIDGEQWSLVRVDRQQRIAEREIEVHKREISAYRWRLYGGLQNPWKLRDILDYRERAGTAKESIANAREESRSLQAMRCEVQHLIEETRTELKEKLERERQVERVLVRSVDSETSVRIERSQGIRKAEFNVQELGRLEENAITLRNPQMLLLAEREMELHLAQTQDGREKLASRAVGRAEVAAVSLKDVDARFEDLSKSRQFMPVIFKGPDGRDPTASLHDLQARRATDKLISFFSTKDRFEMNAINQVLDERHADLLNE